MVVEHQVFGDSPIHSSLAEGQNRFPGAKFAASSLHRR